MSAERVTPEELAAVLRAEERWENGGSSERHLAAVVMRKAAPRLAREVERLTAERDALAVRVTEMHGTIAQTSRNASAIIAGHEALKDKARTLYDAADLLLAEAEGMGGSYGATRDSLRAALAAIREEVKRP